MKTFAGIVLICDGTMRTLLLLLLVVGCGKTRCAGGYTYITTTLRPPKGPGSFIWNKTGSKCFTTKDLNELEEDDGN